MNANLPLPWHVDHKERDRFVFILLVCLLVFLVVGTIVPLIDVPEKNRQEMEALPPQLARVVIEKRELPKPEIKQPEPRPEEKKEELKAEPKPEQEPKPEPKNEVEIAREKVKSTGLLALSDELSELRALADTVEATDQPLLTAKPITRRPSEGLANIVSTRSSGGIDTSHLDQSTQKMALTTRKITEVESTVAEEVATQKAAASKTRNSNGRSAEEIRRVFDANKGAISRIYKRELRQNPTLKGAVTFELVLEPDGAVSSCEVVKSELQSEEVERKVCKRLLLVNFGDRAKAGQQKVQYPIDFFPT